MARFVTTIESTLAPADAFAYMADFTNAARWDPSVSRAERVGDGPIGAGSEFDLVARFGGKDVPLRYRAVEHVPPSRVVLETHRPGFTSRDTITIAQAAGGSTVHYDAVLEFSGFRRLLDPLLNLLFARVGARAGAGLRTELNP
jgi:Polyketide cyclase / dehydrase and lipid transport